ncbi:MAG: HNH endonuclease [Candidatus Marinarcus sp.]|uniref:HNH endonuclease n=1 Tax=Candidatus Marinarcus sp. TaxID=3100987 RepID=UPI003AFFD46E
MRLEYEFVFSALILIACLIPLYLKRKQIKQYFTQKSDTKDLVKEIKIYFQTVHPLINLDYAIVEKTRNEQNSDVRDIEIIEDLVSQYAHADIKIETPTGVNKDSLWGTYDILCIPQKDKLPKDLAMRKELVFKRDHAKCKRCGKSITLNNSYLHFLRNIAEGGTYHVENLVTVCSDCNKILKSTNLAKTIDTLEAFDHLISKIHNQ